MNKQARWERIEKLLAMEEELDELEELPLPERFRKLLGWAEKHLPPAEQEWLYQQWQRAWKVPWKNPSANQPRSRFLSSKERSMKRVRVELEVTRRTYLELEVEDDADTEDSKAMALDVAELADWEEDPPEVVSIEIIEPSS
jgi:hypothetical protein